MNVDLFICHASEDKDTFVRPLANILRDYGAEVWYDEFSLRVGDSLSRAIDRGLASAKYGVAVISKAFLSKKWSEYELRGLTAKELAGGKVILPVWLDVTTQEVLDFSPPLADKFALRAPSKNVEDIALKLLEEARPDLFDGIMRDRAWREMLRNAESREVDPKSLRIAPVRHRDLSAGLLGRVRLVRAALMTGLPHSMEHWVDGFKRDMHPEDEVTWWEHVASAFQEYSQVAHLSDEQLRHAFRVILGVGLGEPKDETQAVLRELPADAYDVITKIFQSAVPPYDIDDEFMESKGPVE